MGMSANKNVGFVLFDFFIYPCWIPSRRACDMGHENFNPVCFEDLIKWKCGTQNATINISIYPANGCNFCQSIGYSYIANIACMPYLITFFEMVCDTLIHVSVCIRNYPYFSHSLGLLLR